MVRPTCVTHKCVSRFEYTLDSPFQISWCSRVSFLDHCIEGLVLICDVEVMQRCPKGVLEVVADIEQLSLECLHLSSTLRSLFVFTVAGRGGMLLSFKLGSLTIKWNGANGEDSPHLQLELFQG